MRKLLWSAALVMCVATQACSNETAVLSVDPPQGTCSGGEDVVIKGRNFPAGRGGVSVMFGRRPATNVIIDSQSAIRVTTPAGSCRSRPSTSSTTSSTGSGPPKEVAGCEGAKLLENPADTSARGASMVAFMFARIWVRASFAWSSAARARANCQWMPTSSGASFAAAS